MLKEIIIAIRGYIQAHHFIRTHKMWKWILIPGFFYALLFVFAMYFFGKTANGFIDWAMSVSGLKNWLHVSRSGIAGFLVTISGIVIWVIQMLLYFSFFKYAVLVIGAPIFSYISEKTNHLVNNTDGLFSVAQWRRDILRGMSIALRNTLWQTVYLVAIFILSLIPLIGIFTIPLVLIMECYYYGFSMIDYSCARKKLSASKSIFYIGNHKGLAVGNGLVFYCFHLIPIIGWIVAPTYAVIAATLSLQQEKELL